MNLASQVLFPAALVALAAGLLVWHVRAWRAAKSRETDANELDHQRRRFRRRLQTSAMLALLGLAVGFGQGISPREEPSLYVFFWCGVALVTVWLMALALADAVSNTMHASRLRHERMVEHAQLKAELARLRTPEWNSKSEPIGKQQP